MAVSWLSLVRQDDDSWPAVIAARAELEADWYNRRRGARDSPGAPF